MTIRLLTRDDAAQYQKLRLLSLQEAPQAFLSTYQDEVTFNTEVYAKHLEWSLRPPFLGYFGVFEGRQLIGYIQVTSPLLQKQEHIVLLYNLYIDAKHQRQGLATQLLNEIFGILKASGKIERVYV